MFFRFQQILILLHFPLNDNYANFFYSLASDAFFNPPKFKVSAGVLLFEFFSIFHYLMILEFPKSVGFTGKFQFFSGILPLLVLNSYSDNNTQVSVSWFTFLMRS